VIQHQSLSGTSFKIAFGLTPGKVRINLGELLAVLVVEEEPPV
jgi:hypothetical protein